MQPKQSKTNQPWADKTRQKIITAAVKLFAKHGFSGTSITQIATQAKVNRSLIFHHFTNKENLWVQVKLSFSDKSGHQYPVPSTAQPLKSYLTEFFVEALLFYQSHPDLMRILAWQRLENTAVVDLKVGSSDLAKQYLVHIQHYQELREIDPDLDADFVLLFLLSSVYNMASENFSMLDDEAVRKRYAEFCAGRLLAALTTPSA